MRLNKLWSRFFNIGEFVIEVCGDDVGILDKGNFFIFMNGNYSFEPFISIYITSFNSDEIDWEDDLIEVKPVYNLPIGDKVKFFFPKSYIKKYESFIKEVILRADGSFYFFTKSFFFVVYKKERLVYLSFSSSFLDNSFLESCLLLGISQFFQDLGGVIMHASSVVFNKKVFLFCGPSGVGKSTIISLVDAPILSDDIIFVKKVDDKYIAYSIPFDTFNLRKLVEFSEIGAIYCLKQGSSLLLNRLSFQKAFFYIFFSHRFFFGHPLCYHVRRFYFNFLFDMIQRVPIYELIFKKEKIDLNVIYEKF
ncbi:MAG: hypothetical protein NC925_02315 [Candidatus Omnitrophica bacterium]|nr:hypothetical protein [Candidatus Omnitrophota bacterium]